MIKTDKNRGFTLIELMIVVAIIGALAAIAIPIYANLIAKSQEGATKGSLGSIRSALAIYYADTESTYPTDDLSSLVAGMKYMQEIPEATLPSTLHNVGHGKHAGVLNGVVPTGLDDVSDGTSVWLYDNSGVGAASWGQIIVNCSHSDVRAEAWSSF